jgi:beta-lactam-binding protein with PASTA domain
VLVARHDAPDTTPASHQRATQPVVSLVADGPPGTVPDLRGMSAREAVRKLVKLGMSARASGDGFVVSQDPVAGTPIEADGLCRLVLQRWPLRPPTASQP